MAIIYTYPKLTNPLGNELIVVSDVNNKNSTRLITIADIASLVPGGDGCGASIVNITDSEGTSIYEPPACSPMILTSSDGSVSITGIPGGINLTTSTGVDCATTNQIGGLKAYPTQVQSGAWPQPIEEGTYYPIEVVDFLESGPSQFCVGAVKIPDPVTTNITFSTTAGPNEPADPFLTVDVNGTPQNISVRGTNGIEVLRVSDSIISIGTKCATTEERGGIIIGAVDELATPVTGTGTPTWVEVNSNCEAFVRIPDVTPVETEALIEQVYNSTGNPILKGTPLHINGTGPGPELNPSVDIANATNPALMPVSGLAAEDIGIGANGPMIISGLLRDVTTNTIPGVAAEGDVLYASTVVGPSTPWLTGVQPSTESNLVQNVGIVSKFAGVGVGSIQVSAIGRTNATPNLDEGSIFLGNAANYSTELSIGVDNTVLTSNGTTASWQPKGMDLLYTTKFETTLTDTTNPPLFSLPHLATSATRFEQITFAPATGGTGGSGTDAYGFCFRPTNASNIIRVKINFSVLTGAQSESDEERVMIGLHHDTTDQAGSVLDYGWQASGDREFDDIQGGDQIDQLVFYFDIPVADLITSGGLPANAGDPCYFYLKGIYDGQTGVPPIPPAVIFGRNWNVDPTTVETNNRAAGPVTIEVYEIDNNKYAVNPTPI